MALWWCWSYTRVLKWCGRTDTVTRYHIDVYLLLSNSLNMFPIAIAEPLGVKCTSSLRMYPLFLCGGYKKWKERFEAATVTFLLVFEFAVEQSFVLLSCGWEVDEEFKLEIAGTCTQNQATWTPKKVSNRHLCYMEVCNLHRVVSSSFSVYAVEKFAQLLPSENGYRLNLRRVRGGWWWWFSFEPCLLSLFVHSSTISLGYNFGLFYGDLTLKYWTILWRQIPATLNWTDTGE